MVSARRWSVPRGRRSPLRARLGRARRGGGGAGLVAGYGFEESAGAAVADVSAAGNDGTLSGAVRTASGRFGRALSFDGVNDIVSVPDADSLDLTTRHDARGLGEAVRARQRMAQRDPQGAAGRPRLRRCTPTPTAEPPAGQAYFGGYQEVFGASALPLNTWTHLAATFDGATQRLYVGGKSRRPVARRPVR